MNIDRLTVLWNTAALARITHDIRVKELRDAEPRLAQAKAECIDSMRAIEEENKRIVLEKHEAYRREFA